MISHVVDVFLVYTNMVMNIHMYTCIHHTHTYTHIHTRTCARTHAHTTHTTHHTPHTTHHTPHTTHHTPHTTHHTPHTTHHTTHTLDNIIRITCPNEIGDSLSVPGDVAVTHVSTLAAPVIGDLDY